MLFVANERNTTKLHNDMGKSDGEMSDEKTGLPPHYRLPVGCH